MHLRWGKSNNKKGGTGERDGQDEQGRLWGERTDGEGSETGRKRAGKEGTLRVDPQRVGEMGIGRGREAEEGVRVSYAPLPSSQLLFIDQPQCALLPFSTS